MKGESLRKKKKRARAIRGNGEEFVRWEDGSKSSHLMYHGGKKAWTSVFPEKKGSHDPKDWKDVPDKDKSYKEAEKRGEVFEFKKEKRAEKFAHGSWKKGKDRRDAMKSYRKEKRSKKALAHSYK